MTSYGVVSPESTCVDLATFGMAGASEPGDQHRGALRRWYPTHPTNTIGP